MLDRAAPGFGGAAGVLAGQESRQREEEFFRSQQLKQLSNENLRLKNELLRRDINQKNNIEPKDSAPPQFPSASELEAWQRENAWFGSDRPMTEFALLYAQQLNQKRPDLKGRAFYEAVSQRVHEVFSNAK